MNTKTPERPAPGTDPDGYCLDPRKPAYWHTPIFGAAAVEDSLLLADLQKWKYIRSQIDAVYNDPDRNNDEVLGLFDRLQGVPGRLAKAIPRGFLSAAEYLEIAAGAVLVKQTDPDNIAGDLVFALALVVCVQNALKSCEGWINWKDDGAGDGLLTNVEGPCHA